MNFIKWFGEAILLGIIGIIGTAVIVGVGILIALAMKLLLVTCGNYGSIPTLLVFSVLGLGVLMRSVLDALP
jgi:hypothetical protein